MAPDLSGRAERFPNHIAIIMDGNGRWATRQGLDRFDDTAVRGQALGRAHAIVSELQVSLNHDDGGAIARNLDSLYRYVLDALIRANVEGERQVLESVVDVLETLVSGWREVETLRREATP